MPETTDITALCAEQNQMCKRLLADATSARRDAHDRYQRAVTRCASAPDTTSPEENPRS